MSSEYGVNETLERLQQEHPYFAAFYGNTQWRLLPLYLVAFILMVNVAVLTIWFASQHAPSWNREGYVNAVTALGVLILALPYAHGLVAVVATWAARRRGEQ